MAIGEDGCVTRSKASVLTPARRTQLNRRSLHLAYATTGYNLLEGVVAVAAGAAASSTALLGFAAWISVDAVRSLLGAGEAQVSPVGIGIAAVSVTVMPMLVWAKRRTGRELGSATVVADSMQTMLCTYLSAIVLVGLLLNATLGWSWADPVTALVIAAVAVREGVHAWRGEQCDDCALPQAAGDQDDCVCGPGCTDTCCTDTTTSVPTSPNGSGPGNVPARSRRTSTRTMQPPWGPCPERIGDSGGWHFPSTPNPWMWRWTGRWHARRRGG
jgi:hypothetical protein